MVMLEEKTQTLSEGLRALLLPYLFLEKRYVTRPGKTLKGWK